MPICLGPFLGPLPWACCPAPSHRRPKRRARSRGLRRGPYGPLASPAYSPGLGASSASRRNIPSVLAPSGLRGQAGENRQHGQAPRPSHLHRRVSAALWTSKLSESGSPPSAWLRIPAGPAGRDRRQQPPEGVLGPPTKARFSLDKPYRPVITVKITTSATNGIFSENGTAPLDHPDFHQLGGHGNVGESRSLVSTRGVSVRLGSQLNRRRKTGQKMVATQAAGCQNQVGIVARLSWGESNS